MTSLHASPVSPPSGVSSAAPDLIRGTGEMVETVRSFNWSATSLGPLKAWSETLLAVVNLILSSPIPTALYWGADRVLIYNDGFRAFTGFRHPASLGAPGYLVWKEAWHVLAPQLDAVFALGETTYREDFLLPIEKDGRMEDMYWSYSYSPVYEHGEVAGVFNICQSTTDRVLAKNKLRESETRSLRVLESIGDAVIVTDAEGCISRMNPVAEWLTGWMFAEALHHPLAEVFHIINEDSRLPVENPADKVRRLGAVVGLSNHTILIRRDGSEVHIDDSAAPVRGDAGELIGVVLVFRDVGEKRQMELERMRSAAKEREVAATRELLLLLLQQQRETTDATLMMLSAAEALGRYLGADRVGFFEMVDDATCKLTTCWSAGELPLLSGQVDIAALGADYVAEARAGKARAVNDYTTDPATKDSGFAAIGVRSGIGVPILRHGRWQAGLYVHCSAVRAWNDEEVIFARKVANQTLEGVELARAQQALRRGEARARKILESIGDAVIVTDADGQITGMNPVAETLTGLTFAEVHGTALSKGFRLLQEVNGVEIESSLVSVAQSAPSFVPDTTSRAILVRRNGARLQIEHCASPIREDNGEISGVVLIFRDITERDTTERRLRQAYKMEALGQLTGGIAHDFNNILAIIMGNLELISEATHTDPLVCERIEQTVASAERAADLTRRLLAYARQQPLDPLVVDVVHLVNAAAEFIRRSLGPTIVLQVNLSEQLWSARIDHNQFENALLNLAVNARDAMPNGGELNIGCTNIVVMEAPPGSEITPGEYLLITVSDTGQGMSGEALMRATEPFFTTKPIGKGTGLGLSMVYGFLKQSGGHMQIESELGVGTRVLMYLPRAVSLEHKPAAAQVRKLPDSLPRGSELVLIVEDELAIRRTIAYLLTSLGYHVLEAEDGPTAMVHLENTFGIDLLLTDVILPNGMSGPGLATHGRKIQPAMRVIFSSGYTSNVLARDYSIDEDMNLLNKPFHLAELARMVRNVLDRPTI